MAFPWMWGYLLCWEDHPSLPLSASWLCVPGSFHLHLCLAPWSELFGRFFLSFCPWMPVLSFSIMVTGWILFYLRHYRDWIARVSAELSAPLSGERLGTFAWSPLKVAVNAECRDQHFLWTDNKDLFSNYKSNKCVLLTQEPS